MTYEEFLAKQKKNVISKEIETELKNLVKVENAIKKNKEKERNLFQKLFAKNKKEAVADIHIWATALISFTITNLIYHFSIFNWEIPVLRIHQQ